MATTAKIAKTKKPEEIIEAMKRLRDQGGAGRQDLSRHLRDNPGRCQQRRPGTGRRPISASLRRSHRRHVVAVPDQW